MMYTIETAPSRECAQVVFQRLRAHDDQQYAGIAAPHQARQYFLLNQQQEVLGGLLGYYWDALHIQTLWISEEIRRCGHGTALLAAAEDAARKANCNRALVQTTDFNAPGFYSRQGYQLAGKIEGWPANSNYYYLTKPLLLRGKKTTFSPPLP